MGVCTFLCVLSMAVVACSPIAEGTGTVNLSADALPIPGGYVVPERGNITFTCSSSSGITLFWNLRVAESGDPKQYSRIDLGTTALNRLPGFSIPDDSSTTNPASFTFHNISSENNPSPVQCNDLAIQENSTAMVIVEGSPNCPSSNTNTNTTSLAVTIRKTGQMWLPEWYGVKVISYNRSIAIMVYNTTLKGNASFEVTSLQPDTVYNISVIPCNMVECNESCDVHSVQTKSGGSGGIGLEIPTGSGVTPHTVQPPIQPLILIGVGILVTMVLLILVVVALASAGLLIRRKRGKWTPAKGTAEQRHVKPQSAQPEYAEMTMDHNSTNNTEYAVVAHSNTSAKGHFAQGPSRQANTTCTTGPGNSLEYATVHDALLVTENVPRSQASLTNTPRLPLSSPPTPPGSPAGVGISPDCVQDAGYASLPDSRSGSNRITKVRSLRQK